MNRKMTALFGVVFVALLFGGIAYAEWTRSLYIDGTVETGKLHLYPVLVDYWYENDYKQVAWWGANTGDSYEDNKVIVEMENIYPCITAHISIEVWNDGTIPAGLHDYFGDFIWYPDPLAGDLSQSDELVGVSLDWIDSTYPDYEFWVWPVFADPQNPYNDCSTPIAEVTVVCSAEDWSYPTADRPNSWEQIDPGKWVRADIAIHFNECLPQGTIFEYWMELEYWNWNEVYYDLPPV